ncbi:glycogenin-2 [Purpureocillium lavendulum]|uniref:glycogenin glucosyltransferase n=1 Tax=Purpureocillium lavendulum TaxID=1247861 RepID=A0AB34FXP7_9HYPO|nr:glycogenin-2 [Purpureocillium lavendulum]
MAATATGGEQIYATLLLSDSYLPGALVLAHSLRDAGTTRKLAVMVTLDAVSADAITQLQTVYDYVLPVPRIRNQQPANLYLMNRADLHSAFTKINLWKQTQFSKIVYVDSDVVAYRAPDELFDLPHAFSAAPDIGWPDLFNTGVMVLTPNLGDFYAMLAMADRGISFDGADQGLLNMHFGRGFNRLPFTYNVTPSAHYQYVPAYRHFQSSINMVHFIGANKPWLAGRSAPHGNAPYDEMVGRWWAVYDRHYRVQEISGQQAHQPPPPLVQYFTKGEFKPKEAPQTQPLQPIFPWEAKQPKPTRAFVSDEPEVSPAAQGFVADTSLVSSTSGAPEETQPTLAPAANVVPADPWTSFTLLNAWDDVPEIGRYVEGLQKHRRGRSQGGGTSAGASGVLSPAPGGAGRKRAKAPAFKLTDFPSETERPSLPVTPAPIRRPSFWGDDAPESGTNDSREPQLPEAPGVPAQAEWDPAEQLQKLAKQQSEALLRRLGSDGGPAGEASVPSSVSGPPPVKEASLASLERDVEAPAAGATRGTLPESKTESGNGTSN